MKTLKKQTRQLTIKETKALGKIKSSAQKDLKRGYKSHYYLVAIIVGVGCVYLANWVKYDLLTLFFGTIACLSFAFLVFMPYEVYKDLRKAKQKIEKINNVLTANSLEVAPITAKQIALAKEYKDEGDLYIIEIDRHILYLWDKDHNLKKNFPCLDFEIYNDDFYQLIGRQIHPLSEKIKPIVINAKVKWAYLKKVGVPEHLTIERRDFKKVIEKINSVA